MFGFRAGRFGNRFFGNMATHFLSKTYDCPIEYSREAEFAEFGLQFHKAEAKTHARQLGISDDMFVNAIQADHPEPANLYYACDHNYFQTPDFVAYLQAYFAKESNRAPIRTANPWSGRENRDVFVHVRIGDVEKHMPPLSYFEEQLDAIPFVKGYIGSDSPHHPTVQHLIRKYGLTLFQDTEVRTVQFANSCKYLVLSHGTFSWMMGFFAFDSEVVCPSWKAAWHGDIFGCFSAQHV